MELDANLLLEVKALAVKRRTTLKAIVEHALRRELAPLHEAMNPDPEKFEIGPLGLPVLRRRSGQGSVTLEDLRKMDAEGDEEEFQRALSIRG